MLTGTMQFLSFIGSAAFYLPLLVIVYWCVNARVGARAAVVLLLGSIVNTWLKLLLHEPRPFWTDPSITGHEPRQTFGMPSGHAQNAVVVWGFFAGLTRRPALWAGALLLIAGIGVSRVVLGVHTIGQVLAGWTVGAVVLAAALWLEPRSTAWWCRRPLGAQLGLSLAVGLVFVGGMWAALESLGGWRWPAAWVRRITEAGGRVEPITLDEGAAAAGALAGILAGLSYASQRIEFDAGGELWRRLARVPVGAGGVLALYTLSLLLGTQPVAVFVVQLLVGLWVSAGAPEAFIRLGLAERTPRALTRAGEESAGTRQ